MSYVGIENMWFLALLLTVPRVLGVILAMPFLGSKIIPGLVRNALVIVIAAFITPISVNAVAALPLDLLQIVIIMIKEMALGFILGYMLSIPFWVMGSAGFLIDLQRGSMSAQMFSTALSDQSSALGEFLAQLAVVMLFSTGGFLLMIEVIMMSYISWPIHSFYPNFDIALVDVLINQFGSIFLIAALIVAPIIAVMFLVELGVAFLARYIPQLNVFMLLMPIKSGLAMLLLVFYILYIARYLREWFSHPVDILEMLNGVLR